MRLTLVILLIILSSIAYAEDVNISLSISEKQTEIDLAEQLGGDYGLVYDYTLPNPSVVTDVSIDVRRYVCGCPDYWPGVNYQNGQCRMLFGTVPKKDYHPCGSLQLCLRATDGTQICEPIAHMEHMRGDPYQTIDYNLGGKLTNSLTFVLTGVGHTQQSYDLYLDDFRYTGGGAAQFEVPLYSLRGDDATRFKRIRELIDVKGATEEVRVAPSDPRAPAWFGTSGGYASTDDTATKEYNDYVYACLNLDQNEDAAGAPICDFEDEAECAAQNKDWYNGHCCGDARYPGCEWYQDMQAFCGENTQGRKVWAALEDVGLINVLDSCPGIELVSDGTTFYTCIDPPQGAYVGPSQKITDAVIIEEHEYRCENDRIVECGGTEPFNANARRTGDSAIIDGQTHYCTANGRWKTSLDTSETSCVASGFTWTGSRCCGEPDDTLTNYEDQTHGCIDNDPIATGSFLDSQTVNYQGSFYLCEPERAVGTQATTSSPEFDGTPINPLGRGPCGQPLTDAKPAGNAKHLICLPSGAWKFVTSTKTYEKQTTPWQSAQPDGCCLDNQCWDGQRCRSIGEYYSVEGGGYLCQ